MKKSHTGIRLILLLIGLVLHGGTAVAQNYTIAPTPFQVVLDNAGKIINNACIWTYNAGTTTQVFTYADTIGTQNSNPIRSDPAGRFTAYLLAGSNYKFTYETSCTPPAHGTLLRTADNISGVPASAATVDVTGIAGETISAGQCAYLSDGSGSKTAGQWFKCDSANTYSSTKPEIGLAPSAIVSAASGTIRIAGSVTGLSSLAVGSTYYVGTAGAIATTAPTNVRAIGVADTASSLIVVANPSTAMAQPTVVTSTVTGAQNNFAPGLVGSTILRMNNATLTTISGIAAGYDGQRLIVQSVGAGQVDLQHQNGSSSAANRLTNFATSGVTSLAAGSGAAEYIYDLTSTAWRLVAHDQGAWITRTFGAGFYTASTGTWTVASATRDAYWLKGRTMTFSVQASGTTSGTPVTVSVALPGTFTQAGGDSGPIYITNNGSGSAVAGYFAAAAARTTLNLMQLGNTAYAAGTVGVAVVASFEIQ